MHAHINWAICVSVVDYSLPRKQTLTWPQSTHSRGWMGGWQHCSCQLGNNNIPWANFKQHKKENAIYHNWLCMQLHQSDKKWFIASHLTCLLSFSNRPPTPPGPPTPLSLSLPSLPLPPPHMLFSASLDSTCTRMQTDSIKPWSFKVGSKHLERLHTMSYQCPPPYLPQSPHLSSANGSWPLSASTH